MKRPSFQFYPGDWLKDPALTICSPPTRGIWMDLLCVMHELGRTGKVEGTVEQIAKLARCTPEELRPCLEELSVTFAADVTVDHGKVTVINRRMRKEYKSKNGNAARKRKQRETSNVTEMSRLHSSSSTSVPLKPPLEIGHETEWVKDVWNGHADPRLRRCSTWTQAHHAAVLKLQKECGGKEKFREMLDLAIGNINQSSHCLGVNDRGWKATLNFLLCMTNKKAFANCVSGTYVDEMGQVTGESGYDFFSEAKQERIERESQVTCAACQTQHRRDELASGNRCPECGEHIQKKETAESK